MLPETFPFRLEPLCKCIKFSLVFTLPFTTGTLSFPPPSTSIACHLWVYHIKGTDYSLLGLVLVSTSPHGPYNHRFQLQNFDCTYRKQSLQTVSEMDRSSVNYNCHIRCSP